MRAAHYFTAWLFWIRLILSEDLSWNKHYKDITAGAYKMLRLIHHTFAPTHSPSTLVRLYVSLVRSQLLYCMQVWCLHLMKDILNLERIQRCVTKYILNDYTSCYNEAPSFKTYCLVSNLSNHQLISSTSITTSRSTLPILDQAPATNPCYLNILTTHHDFLIFIVYHPCGMPYLFNSRLKHVSLFC